MYTTHNNSVQKKVDIRCREYLARAGIPVPPAKASPGAIESDPESAGTVDGHNLPHSDDLRHAP